MIKHDLRKFNKIRGLYYILANFVTYDYHLARECIESQGVELDIENFIVRFVGVNDQPAAFLYCVANGLYRPRSYR